MKTTLPVQSGSSPRSARRSRANSGLTLLEMLVASALLTVIVLGLTAMFLQTQKAFRSGVKQVDVFESGRAVIDMMSRDFEQLSDAQAQAPTVIMTNFFVGIRTNSLIMRDGPANWTNELCSVFGMMRTNNQWIGTGYAISNSLGSGGGTPLVGTLYRYTVISNTPLQNNNLFWDFTGSIPVRGTNFHRLADGIVHFLVRAYDGNGIQHTNFDDRIRVISFPMFTNGVVLTNPLQAHFMIPHYLDLEMGILEPQTLEQVRAIPDPTRQYNFLTSQLSKVHIFRQQITIPVATR